MDTQTLGISGKLAQFFQNNKLTPLLALTALLLGLFAILVTPREEEPQIDVTIANVFVPFPGASPQQVESLVSTPLEQILDEIQGIKHVYSISRPELAIFTVQFEVGENPNDTILRLYNKLYSNADWHPPNVGIGQPLIKPRTIDDVPIITITLWSQHPEYTATRLGKVAHSLETELKRVTGTKDIYTLGAPEQMVYVKFDAERLVDYQISLQQLRDALQAANQVAYSGELVGNNQVIPLKTGEFLRSADEIANLVIGVDGNKPIYLHEVADVSAEPDYPKQYTTYWQATHGQASLDNLPAVTIAVAKKPGENAVAIAEQVIHTLQELHNVVIPDQVNATVTRNYGQTADDKASMLIKKLIFATSAVVLLVLASLGWREAIIVGSAVIITLALTLFASWAYGFTLNRVSLFALIFAIGILVDDAIVVVENIHRHYSKSTSDKPNLLKIIPLAVNEVGGPTILATLTVIAALLPMVFVTGLMGPYMSPIPINASMGMLLSLIIALIVTPWLCFKLLKRHAATTKTSANKLQQHSLNFLARFLDDQHGNRRRTLLYFSMLLLIVLSLSLITFKIVVLKMLPFDNKSELQIIVDLPEGTPLEQTQRVLNELTAYIKTVPEVINLQTYAGTHAPINFNGLVRQYYLREAHHFGDIQVNLVDKKQRQRKSHQIARAMRTELETIAARFAAKIKIAEVPPGPPVQSPLVAEIYGPDYAGQIALAQQLQQHFQQVADIVEVDDSVESNSNQFTLRVDREKAMQLGVQQATIVQAISTALQGENVSFLPTEEAKYPIPIHLTLPVKAKSDINSLLALHVSDHNGHLIPLSEIVEVIPGDWEKTIYHKDLLPVVFVTADMAGKLDSPLYGMLTLAKLNKQVTTATGNLAQYYTAQPSIRDYYSLKWDGEWQITYETFRDMGIAYAVGLILIYLLIVAQFRSYVVPLIIMAPIPLTIIGILPGHALLNAKFTATSMIGMIALAGIIVRNSILLVDRINQQISSGMPLKQAVLDAANVRAKPITLTALAAMLGAFFILDDPIFNGLAISLISGILVSTVLTLLVIPVLYFAYLTRTTSS
jgi:multidrug efflux pump subunit AcrB